MTEKANYFERLAGIDVSKHIEKKGQFQYLSWAYAVQELGKIDPTATWEVVRYDGLPYLKTELGYFVEVAVTVQGVKKSQIHPILDHSNRPHKSPTSFDVNTSIQRALVKAIALHGLGLYIYAGEDLPSESTENKIVQAKVTPTAGAKERLNVDQIAKLDDLAVRVRKWLNEGSPEDAKAEIDNEELDADEKVYLWSLLESNERSALKKAA